MIFNTQIPAESYKLPSDRIATLAEDTNRMLSEAAAIFYQVGNEASAEMFEVQSLMQKAIKALEVAHAKRDALERTNAELHKRLLAKLENNAG